MICSYHVSINSLSIDRDCISSSHIQLMPYCDTGQSKHIAKIPKENNALIVMLRLINFLLGDYFPIRWVISKYGLYLIFFLKFINLKWYNFLTFIISLFTAWQSPGITLLEISRMGQNIFQHINISWAFVRLWIIYVSKTHYYLISECCKDFRKWLFSSFKSCIWYLIYIAHFSNNSGKVGKT